MMNWKQLLAGIKNPGPEFRTAPFYAWNAELDNDELVRQIRIMKEMGMGGFFMHARVGLGTPYLGDEWFDRINHCAGEAGKLGMNAWLYDEDRWPSGAAGGLVTKNPAYSMRGLRFWRLKRGETFPPKDDFDSEREQAIGFYSVIFDGENTIRSYRRIASPDEVEDGACLLAAGIERMEKSPWYNGETYLDTMNPDAVDEFIRVTHGAYAENCSGAFGGTVPGIFTDEPSSMVWGGMKAALPWTPALPEEFKKRFGYDFLDQFPELYFQFSNNSFSRVRLDFRNCVSALFVGAFMTRIGEWCGRHGLAFTGHVMSEDTLPEQANIVGSCMRCYEPMQAPGVDLLTERWLTFNTAKQCTSVAHQLGKKRRLTETYGCTGWDFPFFGYKALSDWQYALGINLRVPHLAWYSMEGQAKRDYPASIHYQSPWYRDYADIEDSLARTGEALAPGEERRDLLVIHPIESVFAEVAGVEPAPGAYNVWRQPIIDLTAKLLGEHLDFDFGDEELMSRHASVSTDGKIVFPHAAYRAVLIPRLTTIRRTTLELLEKFHAAGGTVVYLGGAPAHVDGFESPDAARVYAGFTPATEANLTALLAPAARTVSVTDPDGREITPVLYLLKECEHARTCTLFLCNMGLDFSKYPLREAVTIRERTLTFPCAEIAISAELPADAKVYELDLFSGKLYRVKTGRRDGKLTIDTAFGQLESKLYFITPDELDAEERAPESAVASSVTLPRDGWRVEPDEPNVLILDQLEYRADGQDFATDYVLNIDAKLRQKLGAQPRGGAMVQPWLTRGRGIPEKTVDLLLRARFLCDAVPENGVFLALEHPEIFTIVLNGKAVDAARDSGWWTDRCLRKIALPAALLRTGENVLELHTAFHPNLSGLEAMFLLGDFSVRADRLGKPEKILSAGDVCTQGMPYYSGNLVYHAFLRIDKTPGRRFRLKFNDWRGVSLAVRANGKAWHALPVPPFAADLTDDLGDGSNTLELKVSGSRRNSFGPFYYAGLTSPSFCGAWFFHQFDMPNRTLVPFGLLEPPTLEILA